MIFELILLVIIMEYRIVGRINTLDFTIDIDLRIKEWVMFILHRLWIHDFSAKKKKCLCNKH